MCFTHPEWHLEYSQLITQSHLLPLLSIMVFAQSKCSVNVERNEKESEEKKTKEKSRRNKMESKGIEKNMERERRRKSLTKSLGHFF